MNRIVKTQAAVDIDLNQALVNFILDKLNNPDEDGGEIFALQSKFISKVKFVVQTTGWASSRIVALRADDDKPISVRAVVISHLREKEAATTVVFEDFEKITAVKWQEDQPPLPVNKSTTRLYQDPKHLGIRTDGSQRSAVYGSMVGRLCVETLAEDICKWVIDGQIPPNWIADQKHLEAFAADDKAYFAEKAKQEAMKNI